MILKATNKQLGEEIHRVGTRTVLSTGVSVLTKPQGTSLSKYKTAFWFNLEAL